MRLLGRVIIFKDCHADVCAAKHLALGLRPESRGSLCNSDSH